MKIWIENKLDREMEITHEEIAQKFYSSEIYNEFKELSFERVFLMFLSDKKGLDCSFKQEDYASLLDYVFNHNLRKKLKEIYTLETKK